jgi:dihydroorotase-like cyclic amidohydrolase
VGGAPGAPGVEQLVIGVLDAVAAGRLGLVEAARLISTNGARRFGIYPRKGVVREGADADLTLVDLAATTTIDRRRCTPRRATPTCCTTA